MSSGLDVADPLAHRALQALMRAESAVRRSLALELERAGVSAAGFSALVVLTTAGGALELKTLRHAMAFQCPLNYPLRMDPRRLLIIGGAGDRFVPPRQLQLLHRHWPGSAH